MHVGYNRPICLCLCVYAGVCMQSVCTASTVWVHIVLQTFPPLCFIKKDVNGNQSSDVWSAAQGIKCVGD